MTRKDYVAVAKIIADNDSGMSIWTVRARIADALAEMFAADNPRFDRERFLKACGIKS